MNTDTTTSEIAVRVGFDHIGGCFVVEAHPAGPGGYVELQVGPCTWRSDAIHPELLVACVIEPAEDTPGSPDPTGRELAGTWFGAAVGDALDQVAGSPDRIVNATAEVDGDQLRALGWLAYVEALGPGLPGLWAIDRLALSRLAGLDPADDDVAYDALEEAELIPTAFLERLGDTDAPAAAALRVLLREALDGLTEAGLEAPLPLHLVQDLGTELDLLLLSSGESGATGAAPRPAYRSASNRGALLGAGPVFRGGAPSRLDVLQGSVAPGVVHNAKATFSGGAITVEAVVNEASMRLSVRLVDRDRGEVLATDRLTTDRRSLSAPYQRQGSLKVPDGRSVGRWDVEIVPEDQAGDHVPPLLTALRAAGEQRARLAGHRAMTTRATSPGDARTGHPSRAGEVASLWNETAGLWRTAGDEAERSPVPAIPGAEEAREMRVTSFRRHEAEATTEAAEWLGLAGDEAAARSARQRAEQLAPDLGQGGPRRSELPPLTAMLAATIELQIDPLVDELEDVPDPAERARAAHRTAWFLEQLPGQVALRGAGSVRMTEARAHLNAGLPQVALPVAWRARRHFEELGQPPLLEDADLLLDEVIEALR